MRLTLRPARLAATSVTLRSRMATTRSAVALTLVVGCGSVPAAAQSMPPPESRWEVSLSVGPAIGQTSTAGRGSLPPPGDYVSVPPSQAGLRTRSVPSWYFGAGAQLIDEANFPVGNTRILSAVAPVSLDRVLTSHAARRPTGAAFAASVSRRVGDRFRVELGVDVSRTGLEFTSNVDLAISASRVGFERFFADIARLPGFSDSFEVSSTATVTGQDGTEVLLAGMIHRDSWIVNESGKLDRLSLGIGGGVLVPLADGPQVRMEGRYRFVRALPTSSMSIEERDTVVARIVTRPIPVASLAGGWARQLGTRMGIRADARAHVHLGGGGYRTVVTATPEREGTGGFQTPYSTATHTTVLRFANLGPSSLSAPAVQNLTTFKSGGVHARYTFSMGVSYRF